MVSQADLLFSEFALTHTILFANPSPASVDIVTILRDWTLNYLPIRLAVITYTTATSNIYITSTTATYP